MTVAASGKIDVLLSRWQGKLEIAGPVVLALGLIIAATGFIGDAVYSDRALPGSVLAGVSISGMDSDELADTIEGIGSTLGIDVTIDGMTVRATATDLGVTIDSQTTIDTIEQGSSHFWWLYRPSLDKQFSLTLVSDAKLVRAGVEAAFPDKVYAATDASAVFNADSGQYDVVAATPGRRARDDEITTAIDAMAHNGASASIMMTMVDTEANITDAEAAATVEWLNSRLAVPFTLTSAGQVVYTLSPTEMAGLFVIAPTEDDLSATVDVGAVQALLDGTVAGTVNVDPVDAKIKVDSSGKKLSTISAGVNGRTLVGTDVTAQAIADALTDSSVSSVEVTFNEVPYSTTKIVATTPKTTGTTPKTTGSSGVSAQLSYLLKYATSYNSSEWGNYNSQGGDCANFTSQGLYTRGIPMDSTWYSKGKLTGSSAWISSTQMNKWMAGKGWTKLSLSQLNLVKVGDIGVFDWGNDGSPNHVMTVSKIEQGADGPIVYFVSHNEDGQYRELSYVITQQHPGANAWFYSVP